MREAHPVERAVGMDYYVSDAPGIGGRLRASPGDFRVRELERFEAEPADADPDAYPHVLVRATLRAWDTNDFARELSNRLGVSRERVSWAGTKDKHAVTTQLFSVARVDPADLRSVGIRDADLELVGRTGRPILFGDLAGNAFEVVVRDADRPGGVDAVTRQLSGFARGESGVGDVGGPPESPESPESPGPGGSTGEERVTVGVPNYFGQQRFGSRRPVTGEVGLAILRGDWKGAVLAYVGNPSEREPATTREARRYVERTEDWAGALERLPGRLGFERSICQRLVESGAETAADFRAALEAVPTNLQRLFVNAAQSYVFNRVLSERLDRGLPFHEPVAGDVVCFRDAGVESVAVPDAERTQRVTDDRVSTVTRHCERGRAFVTAPLLGTDTDLGGGEPGEIERAVLEDLDLAPGDFDLPGEFGSTGTRRAILLRTDLRVEGGDSPAFAFALPKGSYATVLLREYLKTDPDVLG